jgi:hypothetical protein
MSVEMWVLEGAMYHLDVAAEAIPLVQFWSGTSHLLGLGPLSTYLLS